MTDFGAANAQLRNLYGGIFINMKECL